jgi:3D-(3,5/4)-trihydroxycyclohexane-1,2-dione acylhydrolase (decyclizing)
MKTVRTTVGAAIVRFLQVQYVRRDGVDHRLIHGVTGIFGHGNVTGLGQALEEHGGKALPYFQAKNEQAMVHMATAFAKTRQRLGTLACTSSVGPGATNMITGAATATVNRLPVLLLPGDIFANRRPAPVLQQLENPGSQDISVNDCFKPVSRYWDRINRPEQILTALPEAMRVLADPAETGAVTIALPEDVQSEAFDCPVHFFAKRVYEVPRTVPLDRQIQAAADALRAARRPLIVAGGGVHYSDACAQLQAFAEATGIPVAVTQAGKGALLESHALGLGGIGVTGTLAANRIALEADLVITLGTRLSDFTTASKTQFQNPRVRFIAINVHAADAVKHGAMPLLGDARDTLAALGRALQGWKAPATHARAVAKAKKDWEKPWRAMTSPPRASADGLLYQSQVIRVLNEFTDGKCTVVHASGGIPGDIHKLWRGKSATDYHSEYGYSCMGYESRRCARGEARRSRPRSLCLPRRRQLPHASHRAAYGGAGGTQDHACAQRQPGFRLYSQFAARPGRTQFRQRIPPALSDQRPARRSLRRGRFRRQRPQLRCHRLQCTNGGGAGRGAHLGQGGDEFLPRLCARDRRVRDAGLLLVGCAPRRRIDSPLRAGRPRRL